MAAHTKVAVNSFGGPAGQIAVMHRVYVEERGWVDENRFLHALNYCMFLPGPEAQQLATYIGWLLHRVKGGLVAGSLFVLPGFLAILLLSILYAGYRDLSWVQALFFGIKPAVLAVVLQAVGKIGSRALKNKAMIGLAAVSFVAIFFFSLPFPLIIIGSALIGLAGSWFWPDTFAVIKGHETDDRIDSSQIPRPSLSRTAKVLSGGLALWFIPLLIIGAVLGW
ncbi:MAG: chromate transporter, partial [Thiohalorhabdaceae bacterium]